MRLIAGYADKSIDAEEKHLRTGRALRKIGSGTLRAVLNSPVNADSALSFKVTLTGRFYGNRCS